MKTLASANLGNKKVLVRVDFNVPIKEGKISDDTRIRESLPTIQKLLRAGASLILMSHLGRPNGHDAAFSLKPVAEYLSDLLGQEVKFSGELIGEKTTDMVHSLKPCEIFLMENVRFHPGETRGDKEFAEQLAELGDAYVMDAFGSAHREHSSTASIAAHFSDNKYFGLLMEKELNNLEKVLKNPATPFTAIIGGAKLSTKIPVITNLSGRVDNLIIGGGMAYTFIKALGGNIGKSLAEKDLIDNARKTIHQLLLNGTNVLLPVDSVAADNFSNDAQKKEIRSANINEDWMGLDIGQKAIRQFSEVIKHSSTILWNGPMGVFEMEHFKKGTIAIAKAISEATKSGGYSLVGGGDSVAALNQNNMTDQVSYVSTGGGAMLEYIEGKQLPGVKAILD